MVVVIVAVWLSLLLLSGRSASRSFHQADVGSKPMSGAWAPAQAPGAAGLRFREPAELGLGSSKQAVQGGGGGGFCWPRSFR